MFYGKKGTSAGIPFQGLERGKGWFLLLLYEIHLAKSHLMCSLVTFASFMPAFVDNIRCGEPKVVRRMEQTRWKCNFPSLLQNSLGYMQLSCSRFMQMWSTSFCWSMQHRSHIQKTPYILWSRCLGNPRTQNRVDIKQWPLRMGMMQLHEAIFGWCSAFNQNRWWDHFFPNLSDGMGCRWWEFMADWKPNEIFNGNLYSRSNTEN